MLKAPDARQPWKTFAKHAAKENAGLAAMGEAASASTLEHELRELVKIRASQLNGCAFCLNMHMTDARKINMPEEKITLLPAWREAPVYSERERAALAMTESITLIANHHGVEDDVYEDATRVFNEAEVAQLIAAIANINAWNRIAITYRFAPQIATAKAA
jgi:AhpD family alkylhydroperoxidase